VSEAREAFQSALRYAPYEAIASNAKAAIAIAYGEECRSHGRWNEAIGYFNEAVEYNADDANAYLARARTRMSMADAKGAMADFTRAIECNPHFAHSYNGRASAAIALGDWDRARKDLEEAMKRNPRIPDTYFNRALVRMQVGDLAGAREDLSQTALLSPESLPKLAPYFARLGILRYNNCEFGEALVDIRRASGAGYQSEYTPFFIWMIRSRLGEHDAATRDLVRVLDTWKDAKADDWILTIGLFLAGQLTEGELFKAARNSDLKVRNEKLCEAFFYAGTKRLIQEDEVFAVSYFRQCIGTQVTNFSEYGTAVAELQRLAPTSLRSKQATSQD
jgi:tetratricopeptide (TPR) repeat protein